MIYAPATFVIKGVMVLIAYFDCKMLVKEVGNTVSAIISGIAAEIFMVVGYYVFEGFLYGFIPSVVNIPANCVQGVAGIVIGVVLMKVFKKIKLY